MPNTYKNIIDALELQVRNFDAFPDETTKLQEQVNAVYRYAVAIAKSLPLHKFQLKVSEELAGEVVFNGLNGYAMPDDINETRPDAGVHFINFKGCQKQVTVLQSNPIETVKRARGNFFQKGTFLFTFDPTSKKIFSAPSNAPITLEYAPKITKATTVEYDPEEESTFVSYENVVVPFDDNSIEVLVEALAAQFTSVNARDLSASQIHSTLSQILSE